MVAVDTNVLVRLLTRDDPRQASQAEALFQSEEIWIAKSVLLETEWVLRALYGFTAAQVLAALRGVAGLPRVQLEDPVAAAQALDWSEKGLDFADALHLASRGAAEKFLSFDRSFLKLARRAGVQKAALLE